MMSAGSLSTLGWIPSGPMGLYKSNWLKRSLTQSFFTPILPLSSVIWKAWGQIFPVKIKIKRHRDFFVLGHHFYYTLSSGLTGFYPSFCCQYAFRSPSHILLVFIPLHSYVLEPCFCNPPGSLYLLPPSVALLFASVRVSSFIHADFLPHLLDLRQTRMDYLGALRKLSWKVNWIIPGPFPLLSRSPLDDAKEIPKPAALLKTRAVTLLFVLLTSLSLTSESHSCCWQGFHCSAHLQRCSSLLVTAGPTGLP